MKIDRPTPEDIHAVALAMRDHDLVEFLALSFAQDRAEMAAVLTERLAGRADVLVAGLDEPICVGATTETRPGVISLLFFATDRFSEIGLPITRFIVATLFPKLREAGAHRIETLALATNHASQNWLQTLGLSPETGPLQGYGRDGEEYIQYAWVRQ